MVHTRIVVASYKSVVLVTNYFGWLRIIAASYDSVWRQIQIVVDSNESVVLIMNYCGNIWIVMTSYESQLVLLGQ